MNNLFANIQEAQEERQSIQMADGITSSVEELHRCEVLTVVNRYFPKGDPKPFFEKVEEHRGKVATDKLRDDCRKEWKKRKEAV